MVVCVASRVQGVYSEFEVAGIKREKMTITLNNLNALMGCQSSCFLRNNYLSSLSGTEEVVV
jgi:hypothetical protein